MRWAKRQLEGIKSIAAWRWFLAGLLGSLAVLAVCIKVEFPADWWLEEASTPGGERDPKPWAPWLGNGTAIVAAVTAFVAPIKGGFSKHEAEIELELARSVGAAERKLQDVANTIFATVADSEQRQRQGVELWKHMTVRVMIVTRTMNPARLTIVGEARNHARLSSGMVWTEGKGVVGIAWRDRSSLYRDLQGSHYQLALASRQAWEQANPGLTQGLTYDDATRLAQQPFGAVAAFAVATSTDVLGVISIDVPPGHVALFTTGNATRDVQRIANLSVQEFEVLWDAYGANGKLDSVGG